MKKKIQLLRGDTILWVVYILLSVISLIAVYSAIGYSAISDNHTSPTAQFLKHALFVVLSFVIVIVLSKVSYKNKKLTRLSVILYALSLVGLAWTALNRTRWIYIPHTSFSIQPSELAKIMLILMLARIFAKNKEDKDSVKLFWIAIALIAVTFMLTVGQNLSTAMLIFATCFLLLWMAGANKTWMMRLTLGLIILGVVGFAAIYFLGDKVDLGRSTTWHNRLHNFFSPDPTVLNQENIARMAVARGGVTGSGVGTTIHGRLMTQAHNDFIFSVIIEEAGMVAAIFIFALYALLYFRCIKIVKNCNTVYGSLGVAGIGTLITLQAMINMLVAVGFLPVTGQTLPFVSAGGSSFLFMAIGMGFIQSVAYQNKKEALLAQAQAQPTPEPEQPANNESEQQNIE